ncbi:MAG: tetratricopeptide repeat protein [Planctomycetales bacterium]|nr:tetratricopeptide repeat protein [Planctomycetales bacterium]
MSIRIIWSFLAAAALLCPGIAHSALGQTESEPAAATAPKKITARQVLEATFAKTTAAKTVDDFSEVIEQCERVLGVKLSAENLAYAHELAAWGYNRRGEAYAQEAASLSDKGNERKANELDEVALADFEAALVHDPKKWKAVQNRGVSLALRGQIDEAIADFTKVVELNPKYDSAWFNRAELLAKQGKFSEAAGDYDEALKLKPDDLGALFGRGNAQLRLRKFRAALNDFARALQIEPQSPQALAGRGDVHSEIGQWEEAAEDYRRAIKLSPKFGRGYRGAAWLMATCPEDRFRDAELAVASARQALALDGNGDYAYLDTLAAALANAGEFEDAKATQEKAIQIAPDAAISELRERLTLYRSGRPYRTTSRTAKGEDAVETR